MNNITSAEFISDLLSSAEQLNLNNDMQEALCKARYETMCKYSPVQEYKCQVGIYFMPQSQMETIYVDTCLQCEIQDLIRKHGVHTVGSCCGHGVMQGYIQVSEHSVKKCFHLDTNSYLLTKMETELIVLNLKQFCISKIIGRIVMRKNKLGWAVGIVICSHCNKKWVAVRPTKTKEKQLECPKCGRQVAKRSDDNAGF